MNGVLVIGKIAGKGTYFLKQCFAKKEQGSAA
jgi:hypothetical protein